jgi:hypothetical protein
MHIALSTVRGDALRLFTVRMGWLIHMPIAQMVGGGVVIIVAAAFQLRHAFLFEQLIVAVVAVGGVGLVMGYLLVLTVQSLWDAHHQLQPPDGAAPPKSATA